MPTQKSFDPPFSPRAAVPACGHTVPAGGNGRFHRCAACSDTFVEPLSYPLYSERSNGGRGGFAELKKPEMAFKCLIRFVLAQTAVPHGIELMTVLFNIAQGMVSTIMGASGLSAPTGTTPPSEMVGILVGCIKMSDRLIGKLMGSG